jgi:Tfp pilus assembly protein PilV
MVTPHRHPLNRPLPSRRRGVVLVDAIIGAILLGIALVAIIGLAGRALTAQATGEQLQAAAMLLDEQLNLVLARGPDNYTSRYGSEGMCEEPFQAFRYRLDFAGGSGGEPYTVTATVFWTAGGREQSESVQTLIARRLGDEPDPERRPGETVEREYR